MSRNDIYQPPFDLAQNPHPPPPLCTHSACTVHTVPVSPTKHPFPRRLWPVLCCAVLCCAVLCCAVLYCAVLCCAVNGWKALHHGTGSVNDNARVSTRRQDTKSRRCAERPSARAQSGPQESVGHKRRLSVPRDYPPPSVITTTVAYPPTASVSPRSPANAWHPTAHPGGLQNQRHMGLPAPPPRGRFRTAQAQCGHSAHTAPIITVIIQVTTLKTTHLRNHAQPIQISKTQTSDACHGSQGPKFCPL